MRIRDRWISLLHRTATGTKKIRTLLTPIGLVIFGGFTGGSMAFSSLAVIKRSQLAHRGTIELP
jgi:hypothetical protein